LGIDIISTCKNIVLYYAKEQESVKENFCLLINVFLDDKKTKQHLDGKKMSSPIMKKNNHHDNICEEIMRERAAVLSRAGNALNDALDRLNALGRDIEHKIRTLELKKNKENTERYPAENMALFSEINCAIDKFNAEHEKAQLKYYYLIVTREAMGLRRHDRVYEIYKLPEKMQKIRNL